MNHEIPKKPENGAELIAELGLLAIKSIQELEPIMKISYLEYLGRNGLSNTGEFSLSMMISDITDAFYLERIKEILSIYSGISNNTEGDNFKASLRKDLESILFVE